MAEQSPQTAPWESLGFEKRDLDGSAERAIAIFRGWNGPPQSPEDVWHWLFNVYSVASRTFAMGVLGYTIEHPVLRDWREPGRQLVNATVHFLFGPWRESFLWEGKLIDREQARAKLPWISYYRNALMIALSSSDWASADRLIEWPGPDLNDDEGFDDHTAEDNAYQIWLAMRLRGESGSEVDARRDLMARRSRQRPKLLALAADALFAAEPDQLAKTLSDHLKYYRKREIDLSPKPYGRPVQEGISLDGTGLWHLARRRGLGEIPLPDELMLMIARP
jgi:hypothetical protein